MPLSAADAAAFERDGFVVLRDIFSEADLAPIRRLLDAWVGDVVAELEAAGALRRGECPAELGLDERMAAVDRALPGMPFAMQGAFLADRARVMRRPEFRRLRGHPAVLDAAAALLGTAEVAAHPNFTIRIRTPTPQGEPADLGRTPWHQDAAYLLDDAKDTAVLAFWVPLQRVSRAIGNGPLQFVAGAHRAGEVLRHAKGATGAFAKYLLVEPADFDRAFGRLPVATPEVAAGSCVVFGSRTPHRSLQNTTPRVRWSFDMRYQDSRLPHGQGKNGGLVPLRSAAPGFVPPVEWREGPLGPTSEVLGAYSRRASAAAIAAEADVGLKRQPRELPRTRSMAPGDSPAFRALGPGRL